MIISKKRKDISGLNEIGFICLRASVYAPDKLPNNEGIMIIFLLATDKFFPNYNNALLQHHRRLFMISLAYKQSH
jgi:hypothetical protein